MIRDHYPSCKHYVPIKAGVAPWQMHLSFACPEQTLLEIEQAVTGVLVDRGASNVRVSSERVSWSSEKPTGP